MMKIIATPSGNSILLFQENVCMCVCHTCLLSIEAFFFSYKKRGMLFFRNALNIQYNLSLICRLMSSSTGAVGFKGLAQGHLHGSRGIGPATFWSQACFVWTFRQSMHWEKWAGQTPRSELHTQTTEKSHTLVIILWYTFWTLIFFVLT